MSYATRSSLAISSGVSSGFGSGVLTGGVNNLNSGPSSMKYAKGAGGLMYYKSPDGDQQPENSIQYLQKYGQSSLAEIRPDSESKSKCCGCCATSRKMIQTKIFLQF